MRLRNSNGRAAHSLRRSVVPDFRYLLSRLLARITSILCLGLLIVKACWVKLLSNLFTGHITKARDHARLTLRQCVIRSALLTLSLPRGKYPRTCEHPGTSCTVERAQRAECLARASRRLFPVATGGRTRRGRLSLLATRAGRRVVRNRAE